MDPTMDPTMQQLMGDMQHPAPPTEEEVIQAANHQVAMTCLPSLISTHPKMAPKALVDKAYKIAVEITKRVFK